LLGHHPIDLIGFFQSEALGTVPEGKTAMHMSTNRHPDRQLVRKLGIVVVIKLALITGLWWAFVKDQQVHVDADQATLPWAASAPQTTPNRPPERPEK